jgi:hypothetical protein
VPAESSVKVNFLDRGVALIVLVACSTISARAWPPCSAKIIYLLKGQAFQASPLDGCWPPKRSFNSCIDELPQVDPIGTWSSFAIWRAALRVSFARASVLEPH